MCLWKGVFLEVEMLRGLSWKGFWLRFFINDRDQYIRGDIK